MEFLGVGPLELIFIMIIAILVIGPRDIGKTAKTIGRFLNRVYKSDEWRSLMEASRSLRTLPNRLAREAELEELNSIKQSLKETSDDLQRTRDNAVKDAKTSVPSLTPNPFNEDDAMKAWRTPPDKYDGEAASTEDSSAEARNTGKDEIK